MTKAELVKRLIAIKNDPTLDTEEGHAAADEALVKFISDLAVSEAYHAIDKWYA